MPTGRKGYRAVPPIFLLLMLINKQIFKNIIFKSILLSIAFICICSCDDEISVNNDKLPINYVDLGLPSGNLWATTNLGASLPFENGNYYAWGEITSKKVFDWNTYTFMDHTYNSWNGINKYTFEDNAYVDYSGKIGYENGIAWYYEGKFSGDNKTYLDILDDAVYNLTNGEAQIPSPEDFQELKEFCEWTWEKINGHYGYKIVGNDNEIFLPASGICFSSEIRYANENGYYWTNSLNKMRYSDIALYFSISQSYFSVSGNSRQLGLNIRAVKKVK